MVDRYQSRIRVPSVAAAAPQSAPGATVAQGVFNVASVAQSEASRRLQERAQADDALGYAAAMSRYQTGLQKLEREEQQNAGVGGSGYVGSVQGRREALRQEVLAGLPSYLSELGRARITEAFTLADGDSDMRAIGWAEDQNQSWRMDTLQEVANVSIGRVIADPDAAVDVQGEISRLIEAGGFAPDQRRALTRVMAVDLAQSAVSGFLKEGRLDEAFDVIERMRPELSPEEQLRLDGAIETWRTGAAQVSYEDQLDREASTLIYSLDQRDLVAASAFLQENRDRMNADDYEQHVKAIRTLTEEGPLLDSMNLVQERELTERIRAGDVSRDELNTIERDGAADGWLTSNSIGRLEAAFTAREDDLLGAGLDIVKAAFSQSSFTDSFNSTIELQRADASDAIIEWRLANPKATRAEIRTAAYEIAAEVRQRYDAEYGDVGPYGAPATVAEVADITARVMADFTAGTITAQDADQYLQLLELHRQQLLVEEASSG